MSKFASSRRYKGLEPIATMRPRVTLQLPRTAEHSIALPGARVLLIGYGYVARALETALEAAGAILTHTVRGAGSLPFGSDAMRRAFAAADIVLVSVPPGRRGAEPTLAALRGQNTQARWIGYLSATSVYGDRAGRWAFEAEAPTPGLARGHRRSEAELAWLETYPQTQIFRLAGIYGPGRNPFDKIRDGSARIIDAPGHVVNRIHIDDIVSALLASIGRPSAHAIYNIADGHPAPPGDVLRYAAQLLDTAAPPVIAMDDPSVSDMARSFYAESKRVDIAHTKTRLRWEPRFMTYQDGLASILDARRSDQGVG